MHISALLCAENSLLPSLHVLHQELASCSEKFKDVVKIGRTHLQDATPITLGQEFSGYETQVSQASSRIKAAEEELRQLAIGGTAVGTGLNAFRGFDSLMCEEISKTVRHRFEPAVNKFAALASHDSLVYFSGVLNTAAMALLKIANDIRLLGSGPRCGLGELILPENEPGSSIMPGALIS